MPHIPITIAEVSPEWLTETLRRHGCFAHARVTGIVAETIGAEVGFLDSLARLKLVYDRHEVGAPPSVVVKVPAAGSLYRQIADRYHAYEREVRFYKEVALRSPIRMPHCYYAEFDREASAALLVLEDLGALAAGDQVRGLTTAQMQAAVETMGRFHAAWWESPALGALEWMPTCNLRPERYRECWPRFRETIGPRLPAAALALGEKLVEHLDALLTALEARPWTIVHSDCRADNMLFDDPKGPNPVVVLDWQLAIRGRGIMDVARLMCGSMSPADRAACEREFLRRWHDTLLAGGVTGYTLQDVLDDYRRAVWLCLYYPVTIHKAEEAGGPRGTALAAAQIDRIFTAALEW